MTHPGARRGQVNTLWVKLRQEESMRQQALQEASTVWSALEEAELSWCAVTAPTRCHPRPSMRSNWSESFPSQALTCRRRVYACGRLTRRRGNAPHSDETPHLRLGGGRWRRLNETKARAEEREKLQARTDKMSNRFGAVVASHYAARLLTSAFSTWVQSHLRRMALRTKEKRMRQRCAWWSKRGAFNDWKCIIAHYRERATLVKLVRRRQRTHNGAPTRNPNQHLSAPHPRRLSGCVSLAV